VAAGTEEFDLCMLNFAQSTTLIGEGNFYDYFRIPNIDLSQPYWDQAIVSDLSMAGRLFYGGNQFSLALHTATFTGFFNKSIIEELHLDNPYTLVLENKWTIDRYFNMARAALSDLNGDGVFDRNDRYGVIGTSQMPLAILQGAGITFIGKDSGGIPYVEIGSPGFTDVFNAVMSHIQGEQFFVNAEARPGFSGSHNPMFFEGKSLFKIVALGNIDDKRAMDDDFGIIPQPKLNENQEHFVNRVGTNSSPMFVPITASEIARTGLILEALSAESHKSVIPVFYETYMKDQMARDEYTPIMLDIIFNSRKYDLSTIFPTHAQTSFLNQIVNPQSLDLASFVERHKASIELEIHNMVELYNQLP
jgi:hypothetical protein